MYGKRPNKHSDYRKKVLKRKISPTTRSCQLRKCATYGCANKLTSTSSQSAIEFEHDLSIHTQTLNYYSRYIGFFAEMIGHPFTHSSSSTIINSVGGGWHYRQTGDDRLEKSDRDTYIMGDENNSILPKKKGCHDYGVSVCSKQHTKSDRIDHFASRHSRLMSVSTSSGIVCVLVGICSDSLWFLNRFNCSL